MTNIVTDQHEKVIRDIVMNDYDLRPSVAKRITDKLLVELEKLVKEEKKNEG